MLLVCLKIGNHLRRDGGKPYQVAVPIFLQALYHLPVEILGCQLLIHISQVHLEVGQELNLLVEGNLRAFLRKSNQESPQPFPPDVFSFCLRVTNAKSLSSSARL